MNTLRLTAKAFLTRALVLVPIAVLLVIVLTTCWIAAAARDWRWDEKTGFGAYIVYAVGIQIFLTGVAGFVAATTLELLWNERAQLAPSPRAAHAAVAFVILALLIAICGGAGVRAGFGTYTDGPTGVWAISLASAGLGVWTVSSGAFWWVPTILFFFVIANAGDHANPHALRVEGLTGAVAVVAWFARVMTGRAGTVPWDARILATLTEWIEHLFTTGPLRGVAARLAARASRESRTWHVARWWPGATSGNEWFPLLFVAPMAWVMFQVGRVDLGPELPQKILMGMATLGVMMALGLTGERSRWIECESVRPVRRAALLREVAALILWQVGGVWTVAAVAMTAALAHGGWCGLTGPGDAVGWVAWTGALILATLAAVWWVHRHPSALLGLFTAITSLIAGWFLARLTWNAAGAAGIWSANIVLAAVAVFVMRDAHRRWLVTDLSDPEGARRLSPKLERVT